MSGLGRERWQALNLDPCCRVVQVDKLKSFDTQLYGQSFLGKWLCSDVCRRIVQVPLFCNLWKPNQLRQQTLCGPSVQFTAHKPGWVRLKTPLPCAACQPGAVPLLLHQASTHHMKQRAQRR